MKINRFALVFALIISAGCASLPQSSGIYDNHVFYVNPSEMNLGKVAKSTATLETITTFLLNETETAQSGGGSGVIIGSQYILTLTHVVYQTGFDIQTPAGPMTTVSPKIAEKTYMVVDGKKHLLKELYKNTDDDIAFFKIPDGVAVTSFPYKFGNSDDLAVGNFVYAVGNPLNMGINVREGIVSALRAPKVAERFDVRVENTFMISNGLSPGDSGTPVVAIRNGEFELVGISQGVIVPHNRLGWAVRINAIRDILKKNIQKDDFKKLGF